MSDIAEIQSLLVRQKVLVDARDLASLQDCYTADATQVVRSPGAPEQRISGREALLSSMADGWTRADERGQSIRMVAEEAGVSPGAVTHHFRSKEKLVTAVQEAVFQRLGEAIAGVGLTSAPDEAARKRRMAFDEFLIANPHVEGYMRTMYLEGGPAGTALFAESFQLVSNEMEQLVAAGIARRLPEPEIGLVLYRALTMAPIILRPLIEGALGLDLSDPAIRARFREATADILTRPIFEAADQNTQSPVPR